jgi:hypothetical protein
VPFGVRLGKTYGGELSSCDIKEFVNVKTAVVA